MITQDPKRIGELIEEIYSLAKQIPCNIRIDFEHKTNTHLIETTDPITSPTYFSARYHNLEEGLDQVREYMAGRYRAMRD